MSYNIAITSDSTCDLSPELKERYNISIIPLGVTLGDKNYLDGVDITPDDIYEHHAKTGVLPKTAAANMSDCIDFFQPFVDQGKAVIHFTISSEMSSTYNNSRMAAEEFENVYVIDTKNLSTGGGLLVVAAAEMAAKGMEPKAIAEEVQNLVAKVDASFVIDSLEYLHKGGRVSGMVKVAAAAFKIHPLIYMEDGQLVPGKKYKGKMNVLIKQYVEDLKEKYPSYDKTRCFVTHSSADQELVDAAKAKVAELFEK